MEIPEKPADLWAHIANPADLWAHIANTESDFYRSTSDLLHSRQLISEIHHGWLHPRARGPIVRFLIGKHHKDISAALADSLAPFETEIIEHYGRPRLKVGQGGSTWLSVDISERSAVMKAKQNPDEHVRVPPRNGHELHRLLSHLGRSDHLESLFLIADIEGDPLSNDETSTFATQPHEAHWRRLIASEARLRGAIGLLFKDSDLVSLCRDGLRLETGTALRFLISQPTAVIDGVADLLLDSAAYVNANIGDAFLLLSRTSHSWLRDSFPVKIDAYFDYVDSSNNSDVQEEAYRRLLDLTEDLGRQDLIPALLNRARTVHSDSAEIMGLVEEWSDSLD